jgi:hypothetical protein
MKASCCLLFSFLCAVAIPLTAPAQQTVNPYDWFKLGVIAVGLQHLEYYHEMSDHMQDNFKADETLMKKLDVPSEGLSAFGTLAQTVAALPFSKDFDNWTQAEQQKWNSEALPAAEKFAGGLNDWVENKPLENEPQKMLFFYLLGRRSIELCRVVPMDIKTDGLGKEISKIKYCVRDFLWMKNERSDCMAMLVPEGRDAVNTIADVKAMRALNENAITQADVDKMAAAAKTILDLGTHNKLVQ